MKIEICNAHVIDPANQIDGIQNVYIADKKIAAIGLRISRWIAFHGCSININNNLKQYLNIVPCGLNNELVTSIYNEKKIRLQKYEKKIANIFVKNIE